MNIAVAITALFSGIFIVVMGGLADRVGRVKIVRIGFYLSILGSLLVGFAPTGAMASRFLLSGRALQGLSGACIMPASLALVKPIGSEPCARVRMAPSTRGRSSGSQATRRSS
jgi:MFS transporter, DHA2 family, multidrug resistance protein